MESRARVGIVPLLKALIIDDEPLAHNVILYHLKEHSDVDVVSQCYNATQALAYLAQHQVDLLFVDIKMPELDGINMLKILSNRPYVIIVSAFQEYAIQGFELDVVDYLMKPISNVRLSQALDKVRERKLSASFNSQNSNYITLKVDRDLHRFSIEEINYFEAYGNYVKVWQGKNNLLASCTLKEVFKMLPKSLFLQIHKSFIVNQSLIQSFGSNNLNLIDGTVIPVGKVFKANLNKIR